MADAATIHRLAELLFAAGVEHDLSHVSAFKFELDIATRVKYGTFSVPISMLPEDLRPKIDESVERNVAAYLDDLDILCKVIAHPKYGRSFHLSLPGELIGLSWDEVLRRNGQRGGDLE